MRSSFRDASVVAVFAFILSALTSAQSFQGAPGQLPSGPTFNGGYTENVDFADVDHDGDRDAVKADGGDFGNQQSRLWINTGFETGGTIGFFADRTAAQFPAIATDSRDMDFVDLDADGDFDLYITTTSSITNQSDRWWINMGGIQGGTEGFFQDQTSTRWTFIAINNGTTHLSSVAPSLALGAGGFIDWACDGVLGDLDNDGDDDLMHSTYGGNFAGGAPSRIFLNNGSGLFEEFNPSGFQLSNTDLANGSPGLWCQGNQQDQTTNTTGVHCDIADTPLGVELGDLDGDLDADILHGARNETPRLYKNRLSETGSLAFRDVTFASGYTSQATGPNNFEQELGDFDNDEDLDLYGLNWPGFDDATFTNNGSAVFTHLQTLPGSGPDNQDLDWFDFDNDSRLDVYVCAFFGQNRLYRNYGPGSGWTFRNDTAIELPAVNDLSLGGDSCDIDNDGDYDVLVANDSNVAERLYKNVNQIADAVQPRVNHLEQAPNRAAGPPPTVVRVHVYDNASWDVTRYDTVDVEHSWDGVNFYASPMRYAGGQLFRGEIRGDIAGTIQYRARATDEHGNVGVSTTLSYVATGCTGNVVAYCTAGTSSNGCVPVITGVGTPSASAASGFTLNVAGVDGQRGGLIFYGITGRNALVWQPGSSSFLCVKFHVQRMNTQNSGGTANACNGTFSEDWNAFMSAHPSALGQPLAVGQVIDAQAWYRDPPAPGTTSLSGGLEFTVCN